MDPNGTPHNKIYIFSTVHAYPNIPLLQISQTTPCLELPLAVISIAVYLSQVTSRCGLLPEVPEVLLPPGSHNNVRATRSRGHLELGNSRARRRLKGRSEFSQRGTALTSHPLNINIYL